MSITRSRRALTLLVLVGASLVGAGVHLPARAADAPVVRDIRFPVDGEVHYTDTFGACRDGCTRRHEGQDLMGEKLMPLVAAVDGVVTSMQVDSGSNGGNSLRIRDADGWYYVYIHINNDTPGTDDGANPARWRFASGVAVGASVYRGQLVAYMGDSGNAESTSPHLHFEIRTPANVAVNPWESLKQADHEPTAPRLFVNNTSGAAVNANLQWATPGAQVMLCDLDGDGDDEPVARSGRGFTWRKDITATATAGEVSFGTETDRGVCGDWDGDGVDGIGVVRGNMWYLRQHMSNGAAEVTVDLAHAGLPVAGDWDGSGTDRPGVLEGGRSWWLARTNDAVPVIDRISFGAPGDVAIAGDWDKDGTADLGLRRGRTHYLRTMAGTKTNVATVVFGLPTDVAIAGDTDRDGDDTVSLWREQP
jgi:hypothetical protein